jgi:outer membrane protein assembly factor BamD
MLRRLLLVVCVLACATGCEPPPPKTGLGYTVDAKRSYDDAMRDFDDKNWQVAQAKFRDVKRKYGYSRYARLSELRLADIDFEQDHLAEAVRGYRQFVHDHRADADEVAYARSRVAEASVREINDSLLLPQSEERDQTPVADAFKELQGFLADYPDARESKRLRALLSDVRAKLIRHEMLIARFYLSRDNYDAAIARILFALKSYGSAARDHSSDEGRGREAAETVGATELEPQAIVLLGEIYLRTHRWSDARYAFDTVVRQYPTSPFVEQAQRYLAFMQKRGV